MQDLVVVDNIRKVFPLEAMGFLKARGLVQALTDVNFSIKKGETLGLVGESGCGKSTLGKIIAGLIRPSCGRVIFKGRDMRDCSVKDKPFRRDIQVIFQDPQASLNPRMTAGQIIGEALSIHKIAKGRERTKKVIEFLDIVGLSSNAISGYPHQFSGGQRQRIGIARALILYPELIVADEPVSSLDVSTAIKILNLLKALQREFELTYLFISHDLRVIEYISDRVVVMYLGKIMEIADSASLYKRPFHPYTQALLSAIPDLGAQKKEKRIILKGDIPDSINPPSGCVFRTRCLYAKDKCKLVEPQLTRPFDGVYPERSRRAQDKQDDRSFACHYPLKVTSQLPVVQ